MAEGTKYDAGKVRLELSVFEAIEETGKVLTFGAHKYDAHNWRKGMAWSRLLGAALRHIFAWATGQDKDPETGLSHLAHAICCLSFLLSYQKYGIGKDDRYIPMKRPKRRTPKDVSNRRPKAARTA